MTSYHPRVYPKLEDLDSVNLSAPANGDVISYDSGTSTWVNVQPSGGGGGLSAFTTTSPSAAFFTYSSTPVPTAGKFCIVDGANANALVTDFTNLVPANMKLRLSKTNVAGHPFRPASIVTGLAVRLMFTCQETGSGNLITVGCGTSIALTEQTTYFEYTAPASVTGEDLSGASPVTITALTIGETYLFNERSDLLSLSKMFEENKSTSIMRFSSTFPPASGEWCLVDTSNDTPYTSIQAVPGNPAVVISFFDANGGGSYLFSIFMGASQKNYNVTTIAGVNNNKFISFSKPSAGYSIPGAPGQTYFKVTEPSGGPLNELVSFATTGAGPPSLNPTFIDGEIFAITSYSSEDFQTLTGLENMQTAATGDVLTYSTTTGKWGPAAPSGGGGGATIGQPVVLKTSNVADPWDADPASLPNITANGELGLGILPVAGGSRNYAIRIPNLDTNGTAFPALTNSASNTYVEPSYVLVLISDVDGKVYELPFSTLGADSIPVITNSSADSGTGVFSNWVVGITIVGYGVGVVPPYDSPGINYHAFIRAILPPLLPVESIQNVSVNYNTSTINIPRNGDVLTFRGSSNGWYISTPDLQGLGGFFSIEALSGASMVGYTFNSNGAVVVNATSGNLDVDVNDSFIIVFEPYNFEGNGKDAQVFSHEIDDAVNHSVDEIYLAVTFYKASSSSQPTLICKVVESAKDAAFHSIRLKIVRGSATQFIGMNENDTPDPQRLRLQIYNRRKRSMPVFTRVVYGRDGGTNSITVPTLNQWSTNFGSGSTIYTEEYGSPFLTHITGTKIQAANQEIENVRYKVMFCGGTVYSETAVEVRFRIGVVVNGVPASSDPFDVTRNGSIVNVIAPASQVPVSMGTTITYFPIDANTGPTDFELRIWFYSGTGSVRISGFSFEVERISP
jgi:hypothetical protein